VNVALGNISPLYIAISSRVVERSVSFVNRSGFGS
jgi:hypothetical protein